LAAGLLVALRFGERLPAFELVFQLCGELAQLPPGGFGAPGGFRPEGAPHPAAPAVRCLHLVDGAALRVGFLFDAGHCGFPPLYLETCLTLMTFMTLFQTSRKIHDDWILLLCSAP